MRKYIDIINLYENFERRSEVEDIFKSENWQCIDRDNEHQIWEYDGKNVFGMYYVYFNKHGLIGYIEYRSPLTHSFNKEFFDVDSFREHISELTNQAKYDSNDDMIKD